MRKRLIAVFLCIFVLMSILPQAVNAAEYADAQGHWAKSEINKWSDLGILKGSNGQFRPNDPITRAEMSVILDNVMKYQKEVKNTFSDLGNSWYTKAVLRANKAGIIMGSSGKVRPNDKITREEAAVMLSRALGLAQSEKVTSNFEDYSNISSWARGYVNAMVDKGYMSGKKGNFKPQQYITRAEVVKTLDNSISIIYSKAQEYTGNIKGNAVINTSGVILKNVTISSNLIISEGVGDGEVTLENVKVQGNTIIRGGGPNSVNVKGDSELGKVTVCKKDDGTVSVKVTGNAKVDVVVAEDGSVEVRGAVSRLDITGDVVVKAVGATIDSVNVEGAGATVTVDNTSKVETLSVAKEAEKSAVNVDGAVTKFQTAAPGTDLNVTGSIKEVSAAKTAEGSKLDLSSAAKVESLSVDAKITIANQGTIAKAEVKADGVTIDGKNPVQTVIDSTVKQKPTDSKGTAIPDTSAASTVQTGSIPIPSGGGAPNGGGTPSGGNGNPGGGTPPPVTPPPVTPPPVTPPVIITPVSITSASAINSKVLFVNLSQAAVTVTTNAITVKDASGSAIKVNSAYLAGWDKTNKTVVVELDKDTTASAIYTVSSGTTSTTFNGGVVDTTKPSIIVSNILATNYIHVQIKFSEPILLNGIDASLVEIYGAHATIDIKSIQYKNGDPTTIILTTSELGNTLYHLSIKNVYDLAGNVINDNTLTLAGRSRDTTVPVVLASSCKNGEVLVKFNININETSVIPENFAINEKYGTSSPVTITGARLATAGDKDESGIVIGQEDLSKYVFLNVGPLKELITYKVSASHIFSADDIALSTDLAKTNSSFVGKGTTSDKFTYGPVAITASSNTAITVSFTSELDKATAEKPSNYTISEVYGSKSNLTISSVTLRPSNKDVLLNVSSMNNAIYKIITASNLKDIENRQLKDDNAANVTTFTGQGTSASAITLINRQSVPNPDAQICVTFNENLSASAIDISHYSISNAINVLKAEFVTGTQNKIILTIDSTSPGATYTLTTDRLQNTGGVPMNLSLSFPGYSSNAPLYPSITAVDAIDNRTLRLHFNCDVNGYNVKSKVYNGNSLVSGILQYKLSDGEYSDLADLNEYVYLDPIDEKYLLIRTDTEAFRKSSTEGGTFLLQSVNFDIVKNINELTFYGNTNDPIKPAVDGIVTGNDNTIEVFFNSAVADIPINSISINTKADGTGNPLTISGIYRVSSNRFKIATVNMSNSNYYLRFTSDDFGDTDTLINNITDPSTFVCMEAKTASTTAPDYTSIIFAGSISIPIKINNISVYSLDKRTIRVIFPEKMKNGDPNAVNDVSNPSNYRVYKDSSGIEETALQPKAATYDSVNNVVTLYFNSDIVGLSSGTLFLGVKSSIQNFAQTKTIEDSKTGLKTISSGVVFMFAVSYSQPIAPELNEVYISDNNKKMTLKFYNPIAFGDPTATINYKTGSAEVANNEFAVDGFTGTFSSSPLNFSTYFEMEGTDVDGKKVVAPVSMVRKDKTTVELTFAKAFESLSDGIIRIKTSATTTDSIFTMTGTTPNPGGLNNSLPFVAQKITPPTPKAPAFTGITYEIGGGQFTLHFSDTLSITEYTDINSLSYYASPTVSRRLGSYTKETGTTEKGTYRIGLNTIDLELTDADVFAIEHLSGFGGDDDMVYSTSVSNGAIVSIRESMPIKANSSGTAISTDNNVFVSSSAGSGTDKTNLVFYYNSALNDKLEYKVIRDGTSIWNGSWDSGWSDVSGSGIQVADVAVQATTDDVYVRIKKTNITSMASVPVKVLDEVVPGNT